MEIYKVDILEPDDIVVGKPHCKWSKIFIDKESAKRFVDDCIREYENWNDDTLYGGSKDFQAVLWPMKLDKSGEFYAIGAEAQILFETPGFTEYMTPDETTLGDLEALVELKKKLQNNK